MNEVDAIMVITTVMALALAVYSTFFFHRSKARSWYRGYEHGRMVERKSKVLRAEVEDLRAKIALEEEQEERKDRRLQ